MQIACCLKIISRLRSFSSHVEVLKHFFHLFLTVHGETADEPLEAVLHVQLYRPRDVGLGLGVLPVQQLGLHRAAGLPAGHGGRDAGGELSPLRQIRELLHEVSLTFASW